MDSITLDASNSIELRASREDLGRARNFVADCLNGAPFSERDRSLLVLAVDEALAHIVAYADEIGEAHQIRLGVSINETRFVARIQDSCTEFQGLPSTTDENIEQAAKQGQLGIYLIRQIVDEIKYTYRRGLENELVLLRFLPKE